MRIVDKGATVYVTDKDGKTKPLCKADDLVTVNIEPVIDFEEFVMFIKAVMTDYDFDNLVTLYLDFKENGGELND